MIYDLDNEYGGTILSDSGTGAPALKVNSNDAGQPAIAVTSTASANPVRLDAIDLPVQLRSAAAAVPAVSVSRTVAGSQTVAALQIEGSSLASGALINFRGGFISVTSVVLTTVANTDYAIPVQVGLETRYIPTFKAAALVGGAAF